MRICVIGAGAIGGFVGARFAFAGHEVSLVARGAHLRAIRERGLTLIEADGRARQVAHAPTTFPRWASRTSIRA
jgi:2-dehydropantoate 2-reductase